MNTATLIIITFTFIQINSLYAQTFSLESTQRALELYDNKEYKESLPYFEYSWIQKKYDSRFFVKYAIALINNREFQKAITVLKTGLKRYPNEKDAYYNLGLVYYWLHEQKNALEGFEKEIQINPKNARAYYMAGIIHNEMGDFIKANLMMKRALKFEPNTELFSKGYNAILTLRANVIIKNNPKKALQVLQKAASIYDKNLKTYELLSYLSFQLEKFDTSVKSSEKLVNLEPEIANYHNNLANALIYQGKDYIRAKKEAEKAIELNPGMRYFFLDTLAWAEYHLGNYAIAQDLLEETELNIKSEGMPDEMVCSIYYHLGQVWLKQNDKQKSYDYLQKAGEMKIDSLECRLAKSALKKIEK